jgi:hypothetical protein
MEYTFKHKRSGKIVTYEMKLSEYDAFKEKHPNLERYFDEAPPLAYGGTGDFYGRKTDNTWKEVMAKIGEQNPRSPLADQYRRKSTKEIKTNQILEKHIKKAQKAQQPKR